MNKYRASIATAVLGAVTISYGQTMSRNSFSSSMIASAMTRFHGVKTQPVAPAPKVVATAARVESPAKHDAIPVIVLVPVTQAAQVVPSAQSKTAPQSAKPKAVAHVAQSGRPLPGTPAHKFTDAEVKQMVDRVASLVGGPNVDPNSIAVEMPAPEQPALDLGFHQPGSRNLKWQYVEEGYFDLGYEKLIGEFADLQFRAGARYGQDEFDVYAKESWLDTIGSGLPYPQAVTGLSVGVDYRHWFPENKLYFIVSLGEGISGLNAKLPDFRYGIAGYDAWKNGYWNADFYGELFYVALADDTFLDARLRAGRVFKTDKKGYLWGYWVGQFWVSGQPGSASENRIEFGPGIGYQYKEIASINFELRGGYAFRTNVYDGGERTYFNPTLIIAGGFYNHKH